MIEAMGLALLKPVRLRRRLWQGAIALAIFIGTLGIGNYCVPAEKALDRTVLGQDFLAFYTAGTFAREGRFDDLYNLDAVRNFEHKVADENRLELGKSFGPYWNPPFYAWVFEPLSRLSFYHAVLVWTGVSLLSLLGAIILLCRMLPTDWAIAPYSQGWVETGRDWKNWLLVPLLVLVSMPLIQSLSHGQNTCMSLFIVCLVVTAWRARQPELAGMACGLLFYKPQLAAVLAGILVVNLGFRALAGIDVYRRGDARGVEPDHAGIDRHLSAPASSERSLDSGRAAVSVGTPRHAQGILANAPSASRDRRRQLDRAGSHLHAPAGSVSCCCARRSARGAMRMSRGRAKPRRLARSIDHGHARDHAAAHAVLL